ncbi:putative cupredoxin-like copper-binding protein [Chitinivorax tropicus]|uniref:Putative cupredoxin-like copper-binding protein n=1 Tax=Chitinivorax tropicus TaxID=714531 RepID=A0A840MGV8_9PROT|nr:cupredoxin family protein [Chitinivorax tropicus]MBB5018464.1 putative cupredoxin-like copper-binding protein [Chitinivorax tropicus]
MHTTAWIARYLACLLFWPTGSALASGQHTGGHGHQQAALGQPGKAAQVTRTITIDMQDTMRYRPSSIQVKKGETVRFVIRNSGQLKHEFSLGTEKMLLEHLEVMKRFPDMEHDEPNQITLAPGAQGEIIWRFTQAGQVPFGCLQPGHYEAGMKGIITTKP